MAPLSLRIPFAIDTEEYRLLVENGENRPENDSVQYFYFQGNSIIGCESVVDLPTMILSAFESSLVYVGVDTGEDKFYDNAKENSCPSYGALFYGH